MISFCFAACADELKKLTRFANVASLLKLHRDDKQQSYIENLEKVSTIYRALGKFNPTGQNVDAKQKALAAEECNCSVQEVEKALETFERLKILASKMKQMQEKGEQIPKTVEEMSNLVNSTFAERKLPQSQDKIPQSHNKEVGRNSPCTCGSGKKFKRCCGRGT
ncbi:hypothetical protein L7F22_026660 [Adiantum nelumboides]|nr:hypothetical protein [Adiantum nelumboides]